MANETESSLQYRIFQSLLFLASDEGREPLPSLEDALVVEIAAGTIDFLGGQGDEVPDFAATRCGGNYWQPTVSALVNAALANSSHGLDFEMSMALRKLVCLEVHHGHGESWWKSPIRLYLDFLECRNPLRSTFSLSVTFADNAKGHLERLSTNRIIQCQAIAEQMKKYICRDLLYIRTHFHW